MREGAGEEAAEKVEIFDGIRAVLKLDQVNTAQSHHVH